jgi:hypothetical protein
MLRCSNHRVNPNNHGQTCRRFRHVEICNWAAPIPGDGPHGTLGAEPLKRIDHLLAQLCLTNRELSKPGGSQPA